MKDWHLTSDETGMVSMVAFITSIAFTIVGTVLVVYLLGDAVDPRVAFIGKCAADPERATPEMVYAQRLRCAEIAAKMDWKAQK